MSESSIRGTDALGHGARTPRPLGQGRQQRRERGKPGEDVPAGTFLGWLLKEAQKGSSPDDRDERGPERRRPGVRLCQGVEHEAEITLADLWLSGQRDAFLSITYRHREAVGSDTGAGGNRGRAVPRGNSHCSS